MKFINGWKYIQKDTNRFELKLRVSLLTIVEVSIDLSDKKFRLMALNFGVGN